MVALFRAPDGVLTERVLRVPVGPADGRVERVLPDRDGCVCIPAEGALVVAPRRVDVLWPVRPVVRPAFPP